MTPTFKKHGAAIIWIITAIAILGVSWWTRSETAWLWILGIGAIITGAWEVYFRIKNKDK